MAEISGDVDALRPRVLTVEASQQFLHGQKKSGVLGKRSGLIEYFQALTLAAALKLLASARMLDQDSDRMHPFTNGSRFRVLFRELIFFRRNLCARVNT